MATDSILDGHILNVIQNHKIFEQSDLQQILKERGYDIPQATISRRLKKLKIAKISGTYTILELKQPHLPLILNIQISDFGLIVLHTDPGQANSLAYFLDKKYVTYTTQPPKTPGILGTIAGDDTVLLIIKSKTDLEHTLSLLQEDFPYLNTLYQH